MSRSQVEPPSDRPSSPAPTAPEQAQGRVVVLNRTKHDLFVKVTWAEGWARVVIADDEAGAE